MGLTVSKKSTLREAKKREQNLTKQVDSLAIEKVTLGNKIGTLEREKGNLEREKGNLEREKGNLEREKGTLDRVKDKLKQEKGTLEREKRNLQRDNDTLERKKDTLETEKDTLKRENDILERKKSALEKEKQIAFEKEQARVLDEQSKILKQPWRKFERGGGWNSEYRTNLVQAIRSFKYYGKLEHSKLVLLGPIMAGKSSFICSIASIDKGVMFQPALVGSGIGSFTTRLHQYIPKEQLAGKYRLMDSMGIEETDEQGFHIQNVIYLLEGNIAPDYEFKSGAIITSHDPKYIDKPSLINKPQCVVIVTDSSMLDLDAFSDVVKKKIHKLQEYIKQHVVPVVLVLTKIDEICADEGIHITDIYASRRIQTIVTNASTIFGVPLMNIYPVQNYNKEEELDDNIDILLLLALRGILRLASAHLERLDDQKC